MSVASRLFRARDLIISRAQVKPLSLCRHLPSDFHHGRPVCSSVFSNFNRRNSIRTSPAINAFLSDPYRSTSPGSRVNGRVLFFSTSTPNPNKTPSSESTVADMKILRTLASYLWMRDNLEFRFRVITALAFLVGAKVLNVQVPFLFKLAVDWLTSATGMASAHPTLVAAFATPSAVLIGYGIARSASSAFNGTKYCSFTDTEECSCHLSSWLRQ